MGERQANAGQRTEGVPLATVLALAGVALLLPWIVSGAFPRSYFYGRYVCGWCGAQQTVDRGTIAGVTYRDRVTVEDTAVSLALSASQPGTCSHEWHLLRFGSGHRGGLRRGEDADGSTRFGILQMLVWDDPLARELAQMPDARQVWHALLNAGERSPEEVDSIVSEWWLTDPDREPFAEWWDRNKIRISELASTAQSQNE